jgi:hypothetical protein
MIVGTGLDDADRRIENAIRHALMKGPRWNTPVIIFPVNFGQAALEPG